MNQTPASITDRPPPHQEIRVPADSPARAPSASPHAAKPPRPQKKEPECDPTFGCVDWFNYPDRSGTG